MDNLIDASTVTTGASMTTVKSYSSFTSVAGWNDFNFDTPYIWDGTSNLVIEFCYDNAVTMPTGGQDVILVYYDGGAANQGNCFLQNGINCGQAFTSVNYFSSGAKPVARFGYGILQTVVQTALNSSGQ